jgi:hypothetical protein
MEKNIKISFLLSLELGVSSLGIAGELFVHTTAPDGKITIAEEARDYLTERGIDYNLDPAVLSPLGNPTGARIVYKPKSALKLGDAIIMRFYNAYVSPNISKCWLVFYEKNGLDMDGDGIGDTDYNLNGDIDVNDSYVIGESLNITKNSILFRISDYKGPKFNNLDLNSILYLTCRETHEPLFREENRDIVDPPATHNDMYNVVLNLKKTTSIILRDEGSSSVCIEIPEAFSCCPVESLHDLIATKKCFIDFKKQFSLDMEPRISYIDSYPSLDNANCSNSKSGLVKCYLDSSNPLRKFVDESSGDILESSSCTDEYASSGVITLKNNPDNDIEDPIHLLPDGWKGKLKISFYNMDSKYTCDTTATGYRGLDFENDRMFVDNNGSPNSNQPGDPVNRRGINDIPLNPGRECTSLVDVFETGSASSDTLIAPQITGWSDDVYIGVNGTDYLKMTKWGLSLDFTIYNDNDEAVYSYSLSESSESILQKIDDCCYERDTGGYFLFWKPNGDEAYIPYMLNNSNFRIIVSNNSCWDAEIYARVWDEKGRVADNVYIGTVGANSVKLLYGNQIFAKAQMENPNLGKKASPLYSVILTVSAPKRDIEFSAYDNRSGKTKMIPVYDLNAHEWTYRNVEFIQDTFEK